MRGNVVVTNGQGAVNAVNLYLTNVGGNVQVQSAGDLVAIDIIGFLNTINGDVQITNSHTSTVYCRIAGMQLNGDLSIVGGQKQANTFLLFANVNGSTNIQGGSAGDFIALSSATLRGPVRITMSGGPDAVVISSTSLIAFVSAQAVKTIINGNLVMNVVPSQLSMVTSGGPRHSMIVWRLSSEMVTMHFAWLSMEW